VHFIHLFLIKYRCNKSCFVTRRTQQSHKMCRTSRLCLVVPLRHCHCGKHPLRCDKLVLTTGAKLQINVGNCARALQIANSLLALQRLCCKACVKIGEQYHPYLLCGESEAWQLFAEIPTTSERLPSKPL